LMKKPALIQTTVRLFPANEFKAATTRTTSKGHDTGRLYYFPLKSRENLPIRILKKGLASYTCCIEALERVSENGKSGYVVTRGVGVWHFNRLSYLLIYGCPQAHYTFGKSL
jgi:hypothetical protein